jgi:hypothetical protein
MKYYWSGSDHVADLHSSQPQLEPFITVGVQLSLLSPLQHRKIRNQSNHHTTNESQTDEVVVWCCRRSAAVERRNFRRRPYHLPVLTHKAAKEPSAQEADALMHPHTTSNAARAAGWALATTSRLILTCGLLRDRSELPVPDPQTGRPIKFQYR